MNSNVFTGSQIFRKRAVVLLILLILILPVSSHSQISPDNLSGHIYGDTTISPPTSCSTKEFRERQAVEGALTLLENKNQLIPFQGLDTLRIAALSVGSLTPTPFQRMLGNYSKVDYYNLSLKFTHADLKRVIEKLGNYSCSSGF
jgi:hypothetical protein